MDGKKKFSKTKNYIHTALLGGMPYRSLNMISRLFSAHNSKCGHAVTVFSDSHLLQKCHFMHCVAIQFWKSLEGVTIFSKMSLIFILETCLQRVKQYRAEA